MRDYLAVLACLDARDAPPSAQGEQRLRAWLARTQRHPQQLAEAPDYPARKRDDLLKAPPEG